MSATVPMRNNTYTAIVMDAKCEEVQRRNCTVQSSQQSNSFSVLIFPMLLTKAPIMLSETDTCTSSIPCRTIPSEAIRLLGTKKSSA